jgi:hypothetical protein
MVNILYDDIAKAIRQIKPPVKRLTVDVVTHPDYLGLRVYEDEIMEYDVTQRMNIMEYLLMLKKIVDSFGVRCEIEGAKGRVKLPKK